MSDFLKELEAKAYQLVSGMISLDDFKAWYSEAQAERADPLQVDSSAVERGSYKSQAGGSTPSRPTTFEAPPNPREDLPNDYTRPLSNQPEPDPDWAVGTGDRKQWPPG